MIHVTARVTLKPGQAPLFLREFRELATLVRQEVGCLDYFPARDVRMNLDAQKHDPDSITILEKWTGRAALESHLRSGHMRGFQERVADIVTDVSLSIVEEV
jgi:quinol monooxygenase YgiN